MATKEVTVNGSDPINPDYYTPSDFYIGAIITVFQQRFKIIGADLYVYRYMEANSSKFPCEVIESMRNFMYNKGHLKDDEEDQFKENLESESKWDNNTQGNGEKQSATDECLNTLKTERGRDGQQTSELLAKQQEYTSQGDGPIRYGIREVNNTCPYPVEVGPLRNLDCSREGHYTAYTPEHVDTPEEKITKYYAGVLKDQEALCSGDKQIPCLDPPEKDCRFEEKTPKPIMVTGHDAAPQDCKVKRVAFSEDTERCRTNSNDICSSEAYKQQ